MQMMVSCGLGKSVVDASRSAGRERYGFKKWTTVRYDSKAGVCQASDRG